MKILIQRKKNKMKIEVSRQNLYLLVLSVILLIFVLVFSLLVLIPQGKQYREKKIEIKKELKELKVQKNLNNDTKDVLKTLRSDNKNIIAAFANTFNSKRFKKLHDGYFSELVVLKEPEETQQDGFSVYSVKAVSKINSPKTFYDFLDAINNTEWIISINFPIDFKREGELISSSFTMKVYSNLIEDLNTTK